MTEVFTEKEKKAFLFNNRGKTVPGPYERILSGKGSVTKDCSKSPDINAAVALSAQGHGEEKKITKPLAKGITKKHNPIGPEFIMGFEVKSDK